MEGRKEGTRNKVSRKKIETFFKGEKCVGGEDIAGTT